MPESVCRVCLCSNMKIHHIENTQMQNALEKFTGLLIAEHSILSSICYVCRALLQRCMRFFDMCQKSDKICRDLILNNVESHENTKCSSISQNIEIAENEEELAASEPGTPENVSEEALTKHNLRWMHNLSTTSVETTSSFDDINVEYQTIAFNIKEESSEDEYLMPDGLQTFVEQFKSEAEFFTDKVAENTHKTKNHRKSKDRRPKKVSSKSTKPITIKRKRGRPRKLSTDLDGKSFTCEICKKEFLKKKNLQMHIKIHSGEKPYACEHCDKKFDGKRTLLEHSYVHSGERPYLCEICKKAFAHRSTLRWHLKTHTGEKPHVCVICKESFARNHTLKKHIRRHTGEKPYICNICSKGFSNQGSFKAHVQQHTGRTNEHACTLCDKTFAAPVGLKAHMMIHSGEKPFICSSCGNCFLRKNQLIYHMRVHSGEKPHVCNICNKAFSRPTILKHHMRIHTGERPFNCDVCKKSYKFRSSFKSHMLQHSGEKPFSCTVCNKMFPSKCHLRGHMVSHSNERPHECSICYNSYPRKNSLRKHMKTHTGESRSMKTCQSAL